MRLEMVDLDQLVCKDCYAFEKDKIYCVKVKISEDYPKEFIKFHCEGIVKMFEDKGITLIAIPCIEGNVDIEFFTINNDEKEEIKE